MRGTAPGAAPSLCSAAMLGSSARACAPPRRMARSGAWGRPTGRAQRQRRRRPFGGGECGWGARRGQLLTECAALDGTGAPQCFVQGLSAVQECASAHGPIQSDALSELFTAGQVRKRRGGLLSSRVPNPTLHACRCARARRPRRRRRSVCMGFHPRLLPGVIRLNLEASPVHIIHVQVLCARQGVHASSALYGVLQHTFTLFDSRLQQEERPVPP